MLRTLIPAVLVVANVVAQTNFPPPTAPFGNPPTQEKELLGMALYFEEQLSSTGTVACATCHAFPSGGGDARTMNSVNAGFDGVLGTTDDQRGSPGVPIILPTGELLVSSANFAPRITSRRAPSVVNSGYHTALFYDGRAESLEALVTQPLFNVVEMGHLGRTWAQVETKLAAATPLVFASNLPQRLQNFIAGKTYADLFQVAFGTPAMTEIRAAQALASYLRTLNSDQSKWDLHLHGQAQLTAQEQQGLNLFQSPANGAVSCRTCHGDFDNRVLLEGPIAGQMTTTTTGYYGSPTQTRLLFHNVGVRPTIEDEGRKNVTQAATDVGKFRVASLRNVELSAPYFHNGSATTLRDVLDFYDRGGDFHSNQAPSLTPRNYTIAEKDALEAILRTLTDPRVAAGTYPFDAPTLGSQNGRLVTSIGPSGITAAGPLVASAPYAPRIGESNFRMTLSGASIGTPTFLMWDVAAATSPQLLDIQLGLTTSFVVFGMGPAAGVWYTPGHAYVQAPMPVPNEPGLSGLVLYAQWIVLEASTQWPWATSNALRIPLL